MAPIFHETASSRRLTREDYNTLRKHFDGDEENVFFGMGIIAPRSLQVRYRPEKDNPDAQFLYNDVGTRDFLLKTFPLLHTDKAQGAQAGRWAVVISYYFRLGLTDSTIETDAGWDKGSVGSVVQQIRRKIKGLRRNGKPYSERKRGRPRKIVVMPVPVEAAAEMPKQAA